MAMAYNTLNKKKNTLIYSDTEKGTWENSLLKIIAYYIKCKLSVERMT